MFADRKLPVPKLDVHGGGFLVTVFGDTQKVGEKVGEKLTQNQAKIIKAIRESPQISANDLAMLVGISQRKIEENLKKLKDKKLLERIGPDKGGYWKVKKQI